MTRSTNRRAVLGAVIAVGAAIGTIPVATATASTNERSESDRQAIERWARYRSMSARLWDLATQVDDTEDRLPEWARTGPKWLCGPGVAKERGFSEEPAIAVTQPVEPGARINIRPSQEDIRAAHNARYEQIRRWPGGYDASMHRTCTAIEQAYLDGKLDDDQLVRGAKNYRKKIALPADDPKVFPRSQLLMRTTASLRPTLPLTRDARRRKQRSASASVWSSFKPSTTGCPMRSAS